MTGIRKIDKQSRNFTVTNFTDSVSLNCNGEAGATALADVVATLILELSKQGIIRSDIT